MKLNHIFILLAVGALCLAPACDKLKEAENNTENPGGGGGGGETTEASISLLSEASAVLSDEGGSVELKFNSSLDWSIAIPEDLTWVSASETSGKAGEATVTLTAARNNSYNERTGKITISCGADENKASKEVTLTQKQKGALILSESEYTISDEGGEITVAVKHNSAITYEIADNAKSWIIPVETKGLEESVLKFKVLPNESYDERTGVITFSNEAGSDKVTVFQMYKGALILGQSEYLVSDEGEVISITLKANSEITYSIAEDAQSWIIPVESKGLEESVLQFQILANDDYDDRSGVITFSNEAGSDKVTVNQKKKGALILSQSDYLVGDDGDVISITVKANSDISYAISEDAAEWIIPVESKGLTETTLQFQILPNESYDERKGIITFSNESGTDKVTVTQKQKGALVLSQNEYQVSEDGEVISITLTTSSDISFAISEDAAEWIVPVETKGLFESVLQFQILPNESYDVRKGTIVFSNASLSDKVTIIQKQKGALILSQKEYQVSDEGDVISVTLQANSDISFEVADNAKDWIIPVETKGLVESVLQFQILPNEANEAREGIITFSNEAGSEKVKVIQKQKGALIIEQTEFNVSFEGEVISVSVKANSDITCAVAVSAKAWIIPVETKGLTESIFQFQILPNDAPDAREGIIVFSNEAGAEEVSVIQGPKPVLEIEQTEYQVGYEGSLIAVSVKSNFDVSYAVADEAASWITHYTPAETKGLAEDTIYFRIWPNEAYVERTGVITFSSEAGSIDVTVTQGAAPEPVETRVDVATAADWVQFAVDYNNRVYYGDDNLVVRLTQDIVFDAETSAAFNATGGIGNKWFDEQAGQEATNYFHGVFDGQGHMISNLTATVPLFAFTGSESTVRNFTVDQSCSFTFTHPEDAVYYVGAVVGYHKGVIGNVNVNAAITLNGTSAYVEFLTSLGGLVGRATTGKVSSSSFGGSITTSAEFCTAAKLLIGGMVGYFSNEGALLNSTFEGTICNEARASGDPSNDQDKANPHLIIGGLVGYNGGGARVGDNLVLEAAAEKMIPGAYSNTFGTIVNKTVEAMHSTMGAVVGENVKGSVAGCENRATVLSTLFKENNANEMGRYLRVGGIVGMNRADGIVSNCINNGPVIIRSNPRLQAIGGIVGWNGPDGNVGACTNNAALSIGTSGVGSYSARIPNFGGVIGENYSINVTDLHNTADLLISRTENNAGTDVRFGGVIGCNYVSIDGGGNGFTNTGMVYYNTNISNQALKYAIGGVVGYTEGSVKRATNSGYVLFNWASDANIASLVHLGGVVGLMNGDGVIAHCSNVGGENNAGEVFLNVKKGSAKHANNFVGGILGKAETNVTLGACTNSGYIHGGNTTKNNGATCYLGGIVAYLSGASAIDDCANTGHLLNDQFNNTITKEGSTFEGGIAGFVLGTAENRISINHVSNTVVSGGPRRGYAGGAVGYAEYVDITDATNEGSYTGASSYFIGGIAGWLVNGTISGSIYNGEEITTTQLQGAGGIVAKLGEGSVLSGCQSYLTTVTLPGEGFAGAVAGNSVEGSSITGCHYKASLPICSDANFTDGGDNAADL